jgi:hypothetical protein
VTKPAPNALFGAGIDWMLPLSHKTTDSSKLFVRMPVGPFAIRVMSKHSTEMLVHISGKLVLRTKVDPGLQYIRTDGAGSPLVFGTDGNAATVLPASDADQIARLTASAASDDSSIAAESADTAGDTVSAADSEGIRDIASAAVDNIDSAVQLPLLPIADADSVFIVVRFVDEPGQGFTPPPQEFEVTFQMNKPEDHDELVATRNLLTMVKPALLINEQDETSFEPPQTHRPTFTCTCTGCVRGFN